jgi:hypothetical protein
MLHLSPILAQGYKDWTPGQWGLAVTLILGAIGTFLLATLGPWILKTFKEIRDIRQQVSESKSQAVAAETKADAAVTSIRATNDRVNYNAMATPTAPVAVVPPVVAPVAAPATESTLQKVEGDLQGVAIGKRAGK